MENKELIDKVIAKLNANPELLKTVGELTLDPSDFEVADRQKPDTMYVLTGKMKVKSDSDEVKYHYHPIIADCFLNPTATENKMVCSESLVELQKMQKELPFGLGSETVILAVSGEVFCKLQDLLDQTIAELLASIRHVADMLVNENQSKMPKGTFQFDEIYRAVAAHLMMKANTLIGSALTEESEIVESIGDVEYDRPLEDYAIGCDIGCDCDDCDGNCCACDREDCCMDSEEDDDEDGDEPPNRRGFFFGTIG